MRRILIAILILAVLAIGGGFIASTAYQAGLAANVTVVAAGASDGAVVAPVVVQPIGYGPGWGWGWHGFSIFGFLGTLFVIFLLVGMIRFLFFAGRRGGHGHGSWGGRGAWGDPNGAAGGRSGGRGPWEARAHQTFDDWHRAAHDPTTGTSHTETTPLA